MTDKEKEAIERLDRMLILESTTKNIGTRVYISDLKIALNLIEKQDKITDLMSERLTTPIHSKEWVKRYYEEEVEGEEC